MQGGAWVISQHRILEELQRSKAPIAFKNHKLRPIRYDYWELSRIAFATVSHVPCERQQLTVPLFEETIDCLFVVRCPVGQTRILRIQQHLRRPNILMIHDVLPAETSFKQPGRCPMGDVTYPKRRLPPGDTGQLRVLPSPGLWVSDTRLKTPATLNNRTIQSSANKNVMLSTRCPGTAKWIAPLLAVLVAFVYLMTHDALPEVRDNSHRPQKRHWTIPGVRPRA